MRAAPRNSNYKTTDGHTKFEANMFINYMYIQVYNVATVII